MNILITAGPTCEDIDPVRYLTNRSSGKMGYALAQTAVRRGHKVVLVSGPCALKAPAGCREVVHVRSAAHMFREVMKIYPQCDCVIMAAAVADYAPEAKSKSKFKKTSSKMSLRLKKTKDILKELGKRKKKQALIGFALETGSLVLRRKNALAKLSDKNLDAIILNTPETIQSERISAEIILPNLAFIKLSDCTKISAAIKIVQLAEKIWRSK